MENSDHKYFTRSKVHGQKVHYIQCEKCDNLVPVHLDKYKVNAPKKIKFEPPSMAPTAVKETLPKRVHKIKSSRDEMTLDIEGYESDSSITVNEVNTDSSNSYKTEVDTSDNTFVNMIVKLANKRLHEKLGNPDFNESEEEFLLNTDFLLATQDDSTFLQSINGLGSLNYTLPAAFLSYNSSVNKPFALGGMQDTKSNIRVVVIANDNFSLDATLSLFRDSTESCVPIVEF